MHDPPDKGMLLAAIARFLAEEVRPTIADSRLNFRVLIAAHLAMVVGAECASEEEVDGRELARFRALYPDDEQLALHTPHTMTTHLERHALLRAYNERLAGEIRNGALDEARRAQITAHVKITLLATLTVNSPRFDASAEIE